MIDDASKALAEASLPGEPRTYDAISKRSGVPLATLYHRNRGRRSKQAKDEGQLYLTPSEEKALENHLKLTADLGYPVRIKCLPSLAFSIARQRSTNKPTKPPGKNWPRGFQKRHPGLKSRRVRPMAWERHENNIYNKITHWFEVIGPVLQDPAILPENVYNMDETGVMLCMLGSIKVLISKDDPRDYRGAGVKRTMVTAIECISANGKSLLPMIIWPATTHRSNWTTFPTPGWHYACSESGYTNSKISLEWLKRVFDPQTKEQANQKPRVLICDGFGTHETLEALEFCFENNIILCRLPSHTSHKLQPCAFARLKAAYRDKAEELFRGINTIGKQHFTSLYSPARDEAFTKRNITAAWAACGLFPFNPDRVLRVTPKPPTPITLPGVGEIREGAGPHDEVPQTPVTPVSAEGFALLHNLIKQDAHTLDKASIQRLERHIQKLTNAAQISIATSALLKDEKETLIGINNEAKLRRSTRSVVLGQGEGKVMSYKDIVEARTKRAVKDATKENKKRGRKCKSAAIEVDEPEPERDEPDSEPNVARDAKEVVNSKGKRGRKHRNAILEPEPEMARLIEAAEVWRAPVAQMY